MEKKVPSDSAEQEHPQMPRERLTPEKVANFPGSLVANSLGDSLEATSHPQHKGRLANWVTYFREGWDDPSIWKSAVSIRPQQTSQYF